MVKSIIIQPLVCSIIIISFVINESRYKKDKRFEKKKWKGNFIDPLSKAKLSLEIRR